MDWSGNKEAGLRIWIRVMSSCPTGSTDPDHVVKVSVADSVWECKNRNFLPERNRNRNKMEAQKFSQTQYKIVY